MDPIHGSITGLIDREEAQRATTRAQRLLDDAGLQRILSAAKKSEIPVARQIFVNRNLDLSKIELVGFDMDYTLAVYHLRRIERLSYDMTVERLVTTFGYPSELRSVPYDNGFVLRGLFVDKRHGNLLKIDRFGMVGRAYHGRQSLPDEQIQRLYRNERIRLKDTAYAWIDTLFALPEACLFAGAVDLLEGQLKRPANYTQLFNDIREAIDTVHRDDTLKTALKQNLHHYIYKDQELGGALHRLRSGGKKLFLLTNSLWDYTDAVMSHLLDGLLPEYPSWRNYFDFIITGAGKPGFFSDGHPFLEIDTSRHTNATLGEAAGPERGKVYQGGNLTGFEKSTGFSGESVLYVGDHIYGDILKSKKTSMWRTCMIVQEIEDEITYLESRHQDIDRLAALEQLEARLDDEVNRRKARLNHIERRVARERPEPPLGSELQEEFRQVKAELDLLRPALRECRDLTHTLERDVERGFNAAWGLHFKEGNENSRFGEQVEQYACLYTSRVSNFGFYSPMHLFRSPRELMPHEQAGALSGKLGLLGSEGLPKAANRAPTDIP